MRNLGKLLAVTALGCGTTAPPPSQARLDPPPASVTAAPLSSEPAPPPVPTSHAQAADGGTSDGGGSTLIADAEQVVARLRPGFKSCYNKGLARDPALAGKIVISLRVDPSGEVTSVAKVSGSGLPPDVEQCIMNKANHASFNPGPGGTVQIPISFVVPPADGGMVGTSRGLGI